MYNDFDIILDHLSRVFQLQPTPHALCTVFYLVPSLTSMLIGACNPMLCQIWGFRPEWGPTPIPDGASVPPELVATNGYDFTNDIASDTYIFLLGADGGLDRWWASRAEFMTLTGPTPLLPDYAFGVWYTWYLVYTEQRAKDE